MTDDLVGRLQQRMAAASEQPWVYRPMEYDDWGFIRGVQRDDLGIGPFRPIVAIAKDSTIREVDLSAHRDAADCLAATLARPRAAVGDDIGLVESARDLLDAHKRLGGAAEYRADLWACLEANLNRLALQSPLAKVEG